MFPSEKSTYSVFLSISFELKLSCSPPSLPSLPLRAAPRRPPAPSSSTTMSDMRSRAQKARDAAKLAEARKFRAMPGGARDMATLGNFITARDGERYDSMAQGTVMVTVSHSNLQQKHVDLRWDMHATVLDVKIRLTKHCGTPAQDMRLILRDGEGRDLCAMDDDDRPLGFYSVQNGHTIHIIDTNPYSLSAGGGLEDTSLVKKYEMSDEEYNKRKNTLRAYKREQLKKDPNFKFDFSKHAGKGAGAKGEGGEAKSDAAAAPKAHPGPESTAHITVGMRAEVAPGARRGEVMFVGAIYGMPPGHWVGVRFDEPVGKSDGVVKGKRVFECHARYGGFVRAHNLNVGDFPERDLMDMSDSDDSDEEL
jgi:tubulin-folding cofactor B